MSIDTLRQTATRFVQHRYWSLRDAPLEYAFWCAVAFVAGAILL